MNAPSSAPQTPLNELPLFIIPPFIWPAPEVLKGIVKYAHTPPWKEYLAKADTINGVLVGTNDGTIRWLQELLHVGVERQICLVIVVFPACPTREKHLRSLHLMQSEEATGKTALDIRILPVSRCYDDDSERSVLPPTAIQAHQTGANQTVMSVGSVGDAGHDPCVLGSLNLVFHPDDVLRDAWTRWFRFVLKNASPLTPANVVIPHMVPAKGAPEAAAMWEQFVKNCPGTCEAKIKSPPARPTEDEVPEKAHREATPAWDDEEAALDSLAQIFQQVYASGSLVTVAEKTRIKPLIIPVKAALLGQQSERTVGSLKQKQSFSLQVLDDSVNKTIEKCRKVSDLLELFAFSLSSGTRWLPASAVQSIEKEVEARNTCGKEEIIKALGGADPKNITSFIGQKSESIRKDLNEMYHKLDQGDKVPQDKLSVVLTDVEKRLTQALTARITPSLVYNHIAAPDLAKTAPDTNWSQPLDLLYNAAKAQRELLTNHFFRLKFSGLNFDEKDFRKACNPFGDHIVELRSPDLAKKEMEIITDILERPVPFKIKCLMVWNIIKGLSYSYFATQFFSPEARHDWPDTFSIITAYPCPCPSPSTRREHHTALENHLDQSGCCICPLIAYSAEIGGTPGWATNLDWQSACDLGSTYGQEVIYHVTGDQLFVSYCDTHRGLVPVGTFKKRSNTEELTVQQGNTEFSGNPKKDSNNNQLDFFN
ncbi:MAG: hypothetical protein WD490_04345 [Opitutales bacterium]